LAALDRIESAVRAGQMETAELWLEEIHRFARETKEPWAAAITEHGRALLSAPDEAGTHFEKALRAHAASSRLFDRARTELAVGEHLRRRRHRVEARGHLRAAMIMFDESEAARLARPGGT
jgi:hypothetical protein